MWQSQDDIIKDLAYLDDFNVPGDIEPYRVLSSFGRGSKDKHKTLEKFIDSRTGEAIDVGEEVLDYNDLHRGKGRGRLLGGFSRSKYQLLQQQLRLARPLGSGDEAIESYCRRNNPTGSPKSSPSMCSSASDTKNNQINSKSDKIRHRTKGAQNLSLKTNALITGLLTKSKDNLEIKITNKRNSISDVDDKNFCITNNNYKNNNYDDDEALQIATKESFRINDDNTEGGEEKRKKEVTESKETEDFSQIIMHDFTKQQNDPNKLYRIQGEKPSTLHKIDSKASKNKIYDFNQFSRYITPLKIDFSINSVPKSRNDQITKDFVFNNDDFPPLNNHKFLN